MHITGKLIPEKMSMKRKTLRTRKREREKEREKEREREKKRETELMGGKGSMLFPLVWWAWRAIDSFLTRELGAPPEFQR